MSSTSTNSDGNAEMYMSQAVADLRQSMVSEIDSEASVYHSAYDEDLAPEIDAPDDRDTEADRSSTPTGPRTVKSAEAQLLVSFGSEELVIRLQTNRPTGIEATQGAISRQTAAVPTPSVKLDINIGTIAVLLLPSHMATLLRISQVFSLGSSPSVRQSGPADDKTTAQIKTDAKLTIKGIYVIGVYDMASDSDSDTIQTHLASYWARPSSFHIPIGHLKLKLESIEATYSAPAHLPQRTTSHTPARPLARRSSTTSTIKFGPKVSVVTMKLADASVLEYIATDTTPTSPGEPEDTIPGGAYPVLLFDNGLPKQYESTPTGLRQAYGPARNTFPEFDQVDWRNSGLQKRSGGGEKLWKVRPKARGALKTSIPTEGDAHPVLIIKKELSSHSGTFPDWIVLRRADCDISGRT